MVDVGSGHILRVEDDVDGDVPRGRGLYHGPINLGSAVRSAGGDGWMAPSCCGQDGTGWAYFARTERETGAALLWLLLVLLFREGDGKRERATDAMGKSKESYPLSFGCGRLMDLDGLGLLVLGAVVVMLCPYNT